MRSRRVFIDVTPLRQSRDLRVLLGGQLVSLPGTQLTAVAVPYQVYRLTHSSATTSAMNQVLNQLGTIVGPALGGILLAGAGINFVYWIDVVSFAVAVVAAWAISPQPPGEHATRPGLRSIAEGLRFIRGRPGIQGAYLIDINAMVFGMPRALFPAMAVNVFGGGATTVGFLYAAPGVGALAGALATGWVVRIRRQGLTVIVAVIVWGAAIVAFGLTGNLLLALFFLAVAGWADVISAVLRSTIIQLSVPDRLRGRLAAIQMGVVQGGPRLGDVEAGAVAYAFGNEVSVISGGLACIAGALLLSRLLPGFRTVEVSADTAPRESAQAPLPIPVMLRHQPPPPINRMSARAPP